MEEERDTGVLLVDCAGAMGKSNTCWLGEPVADMLPDEDDGRGMAGRASCVGSVSMRDAVEEEEKGRKACACARDSC